MVGRGPGVEADVVRIRSSSGELSHQGSDKPSVSQFYTMGDTTGTPVSLCHRRGRGGGGEMMTNTAHAVFPIVTPVLQMRK